MSVSLPLWCRRRYFVQSDSLIQDVLDEVAAVRAEDERAAREETNFETSVERSELLESSC